MPEPRVYEGLLFADAKRAWTSASYSGSGGVLDLTGNGDAAQLGSTAGADTNDPTFLPHDGTNYFWNPNLASIATIPLQTSLVVASTAAAATFQMRVLFDDFTPSSEAVFFSWEAGASSWVVGWRLGTGGTFVLNIKDSAGAFNALASTVTLTTAGMALSVDYDIRCTVTDMDTTTPDVVWEFKLPAAGSWTGIGALVSGSMTAGLFENSTTVSMLADGTDGRDGQFPGRLYSASLIVDSATIVNLENADIIAGNQTQFTDSASSPNTFAIARNTTGLVGAIVDRPMFVLDGVDDYLEIPDHADFKFGIGDFGLMLSGRKHIDSTLVPQFISKREGSDGLSVETNPGTIETRINTDNVSDSITTGTIDDSHLFTAGGRQRNVRNLEAFMDGVGSGSPTTMSRDVSNSLVIRIGAGSGTVPAALLYNAFEFYSAFIWDRAPTDAEFLQMHNILSGSEALPELLYPNGPWNGAWRVLRRLYPANMSDAQVADDWNRVYAGWNG